MYAQGKYFLLCLLLSRKNNNECIHSLNKLTETKLISKFCVGVLINIFVLYEEVTCRSDVNVLMSPLILSPIMYICKR